MTGRMNEQRAREIAERIVGGHNVEFAERAVIEIMEALEDERAKAKVLLEALEYYAYKKPQSKAGLALSLYKKGQGE